MKLLDKQEVNRLKGVERKLEVDEGVKLAKKVDALRELAAKEQTNLTKFRESSLAVVKAEIDDAIKQRDALRENIEVLTRQQAELRIPLDSEWKRVKLLSRELDKRAIELDEFNAVLTENEEFYFKRVEMLEDDKQRIENLEYEAEGQVEIARQTVNAAKTTLANAKQTETQASEKFESVTKTLTAREIAVAIREREVGIKEQKVTKDALALTNRERAINDKYETLLRNQKRLKS